MKKIVAFAATMLLVLPVLAMAGMTAFDNMTELGPELADVTGQVGITIDSSIEITNGYLAWGDRDGFDSTISAAGFVTLQGIAVGNGTGTGPLQQTGLKLDAGTDTSKSYLVVTLPSIDGSIAVSDLVLDTTAGATATTTNSLGSVTIGNLQVTGSTLKISAH